MENRRRQFNINIIKKKVHNDDISYLINLGNGHIASASDDNTIKIW